MGFVLSEEARATILTYNVTSTTSTSGSGGLLWAINQANAADMTGTNYVLINITVKGVAGSNVPYPKLTGNMVFQASGSNNFTVTGANLAQLFYVQSGNVTFSGMSIINCKAQGTVGAAGSAAAGGGGGGGGLGGAIFVASTAGMVTLNSVLLSGNKAVGGNGGQGGVFYTATRAGGAGGLGGQSASYNAALYPGLAGGPAETPGNTSLTGDVGNGGGGGGGSNYFDGITYFGNGGGSGGDGGFGAGGGGGGGDTYTGNPGLGATNGTNPLFNPATGLNYGAGGDGGVASLGNGGGGGGGGGSGLGGAVFVMSGAGGLTLIDTTITNTNTVTAGLAGTSTSDASTFGGNAATAGAALGGAAFMGQDQQLIVGGTSTTTIASSIDGYYDGMGGTDGGILKVGTGRIILTASNGYYGPTDIVQGTLQIGDGVTLGASISNSTPVTVETGATLAVSIVNGETFVNDVILGDTNSSFNVIAAGTNTIAGVVAGAGVLNLSGSGVIVVAGDCSHTGATTINAVTLRAGDFNLLSPDSAVTISATGKLDLNGCDQAIGSLSGSGIVLLSSSFNGPTLTVGSDNTSTTFSGVIVDGTGGSVPPGNLVKTGTGNWIITGSNNYAGTTTVNGGGTLQIGDGHTAGASIAASTQSGTPVTVQGASTLVINLANNESFGNDVQMDTNCTLEFMSSGTNTVSGAVSSADATSLIDQIGGGLTIFTGDGGAYNGTVSVDAGTLQIGDDGKTAGANFGGAPVAVADGARFVVALADGESFTSDISLSGTQASLQAMASGKNILSGAISGPGFFNQAGTGITVFLGASTYTGVTNITAGTLEAGGTGVFSNASAVTVGTLGTLDLNGYDQGIASLAGGGTVTNNSASTGTATQILFNAGSSPAANFSGIIKDGTAGVTAVTMMGPGTQILSGVNSYTGPTNVAGGTLVVSGTLSGTRVTTVSAGAMLTLNHGGINGAGSVLVGGTLNGIGALGSLTVAAGGTVEPGTYASGTTYGTLSAKTLSLPVGAHLTLDIGGASAGANAGLVKTTATANAVTLGGSVQLNISTGYSPTGSDLLFLVINGSSNAPGAFSGGTVVDNAGTRSFSGAEGTTLTLNGRQFQLTYHANYNGGLGSSPFGGSDVALLVAIPEVGSMATTLGGLGALLLCQRLRRSRC